MPIALCKMTPADLDGFAGVEDPEEARMATFMYGDYEAVLITEPNTCQIHLFSNEDAEEYELHSFGIFFTNPLSRALYLEWGKTALRLIDEGEVHTDDDLVSVFGMERLA